MWHEAEDGENDEAGEETRPAVDTREDQRVSESGRQNITLRKRTAASTEKLRNMW